MAARFLPIAGISRVFTLPATGARAIITSRFLFLSTIVATMQVLRVGTQQVAET